MTLRSLARPALLGGIGSALLVLTAWLALAKRLHRAEQAPAPAARCLRVADTARARAIARATRPLLAMMYARRIPGMTIAVAVNGRVIWSEGFGFADAERRVAACPETRFRIGSVSKPITATALARVLDAGMIDLDAPIQRYVPGFPGKGHPITARQLAGHRAGIRHYRDDDEAFVTRRFASVTESLTLFRDDPLLFTPGRGHHYSSYGYVLLSAALEGATRLSFDDVLEQHVFAPLGLTSTGLEMSDSSGAWPAGLTRFYDHVTPYVLDGQVRSSPFVDLSSKWAGGGMLSTSEDLVRFGAALLPAAPARFLRPETRALLFTSMTRLVPFAVGYGMGWMSARDAELRRVHMHFGAGAGTTAWLGVYPDQAVVIALLANLGHAGFTYTSTLGLGAHFAPRPSGPVALVALAAFLAGAIATIISRAVWLWLRPSRGTR